tara:strand:+ start:7623 stop:8696 length:1074 start_codon:yes stop_codon:yes gene_type:complete
MLLNKSFKIYLNYNLKSIYNNIKFRLRKLYFTLITNHYYSYFDKKFVNIKSQGNILKKFKYDKINIDIYKLKNIKIYSFLGLILNDKNLPINIYDNKIFQKKKSLRFFMPLILKNNLNRIKGNTIFFCNPGRNIFNYFHFIFDLGIQLFVLKKNKVKINNLILFSKKNSNREIFIKYFYPDIKIIYYKKNEIIKVDNLIVLKTYYFSKHLGKNMSKLFIEYQRFIKNKTKNKKNKNFNKIIFINRHESRKLSNISNFRNNINFEEIFFLPHQTLDYQSSVIKNSKKVIGLHGAGMANIIFANKNTSIIELIPLYYPNSCYEDLSKSLGLKYKQFVLQQNLFKKNFLSKIDINTIKNI